MAPQQTPDSKIDEAVVKSLKNQTFGYANRRFPFVPKNPSEQAFVREEINRVILLIDPMLLLFLSKCRLKGEIGNEDGEDIMQEVRLHLAIKSLPKYDRHKLHSKTKKPITLFTFVYQCASNYFKDQSVSLKRTKKRTMMFSTDVRWHDDGDKLHDLCAAPDVSMGRSIETLAPMVANAPWSFLEDQDQVRIVEVIAENPDIKIKQIKRLLPDIPLTRIQRYVDNMGQVFMQKLEEFNGESNQLSHDPT